MKNKIDTDKLIDYIVIILGILISLVYVTLACMIVIYTVKSGYPITLIIASILAIIGAFYIPYECFVNTKEYYDSRQNDKFNY